MISPRFVLLGSLLDIVGVALYVRDTWNGSTAPNRVTWTLWGVMPLLAFGVQRQEHIGWASIMALVLGLGPFVVLAVSFHDPNAVWRIGRFDVVCGAISLVGLGFWVASSHPTVALISFVVADAVAALPTVRKAFVAPQSETSWNFLAVAIFALLTMLSLRQWTTAGALFATSILVMNIVIWLFITTKVGRRSESFPRNVNETMTS